MIKNLPKTSVCSRLTNLQYLKLLILVFVQFLFVSTYAQVNSYTLSSTTYTGAYQVLSGTGSEAVTQLYAAGSNVDSGISVVPIPFSFNFNGKLYTSINISVNGFVTFGAVSPGLQDITPISSTTNYDAVIAPYAWDLDLLPASTTLNNISYQTSGTIAGSRIFKVQWRVRRSNNLGTAAPADTGTNELVFQAWFYETSNIVQFQYNTFSPLSNNQSVSTGQVGLRGQSNLDFSNLVMPLGTSFPSAASLPFGAAATDVVNLSPNNVGGASFVSAIGSASRRIYTWTPPTCFAPTNIVMSNVLVNTATVSFVASAPAPASYSYEVRISGLPGSGATGLIASGTAVSPQNLTGLLGGTTYFVYLRSSCPPNSGWSRQEVFTTLCNTQIVPYYQSFDLDFGANPDEALPPSTPILSTCNKTQNVGTGANWGAGDANGPPADVSSMSNMVLMYDGQNIPGNTNNANAWFYTRGVSLDATKTYYIKYLYASSPTLINSMKVAYGTQPDVAFMTAAIDDHPSFRGGIFSNKVIFSPTTTGVYYFGFNAYSVANRGYLWVDEIEVNESTCRKPTALTANSINRNNATIAFTAPTPAPSAGYVYYIATTPFTPPIPSNTIGSGTIAPGASIFTISGLNAGTNYCVWIRSSCGLGDFGEWSLNVCFTTLPPLPSPPCTPAPSSVDNQGIVNVAYSTVNNPSVAEPGNYGNYTGLIGNTPQGQVLSVAITFNTFGFDYNTKIWVNWNNNASFEDAGENVASGLSSSTSPNTLTLTFTVPIATPLGNYTMRIGGTDASPGINGTGPGLGSCYTGTWGTFEDYTINVVVAPPILTISPITDTQCSSSNSTLVTITSNPADFNNQFSWSPNSGSSTVTGDPINGYIINSATTQVFTLTGTQNVAPFSTNTAKFNFIANKKPEPIIITPASASNCQTDTNRILLTASGGTINGITLYSEDFNSTAPGWVATNTPAHSGGPVANSLWILRPNGYTYPTGTFISNDASQFYLSNSDAQGSGNFTSTILTSPAFSLTGYTSTTIRFHQNFRGWINGAALVQINDTSTGVWTTIQSYGSIASTVGISNGFVLTDLTVPPAYVGLPSVKIRFFYEAEWGYHWAIDNFSVIGSAPGKVTWSPLTDLFTDPVLNIPYTGGFSSTVYAKPTATTTYTATSSTEAPNPICPTTKTVVVTVQPISKGTASPDQSFCFGSAGPVSISGFVGTGVRWQYASDAAFTVPNNVVFSANAPTLIASKVNSPPITADRYFRMEIKNGACTTYSDVIKITFDAVIYSAGAWSNGTGPNLSQVAVFASNFTSTGNISACSVVLRNGAAVIINNNHTLTVANTITTSTGGGTLEFLDGANLIQNTNVGNTVPIRYNRTSTVMRVYDFTYWSSPVAGQTLISLSGGTLFDKFYSWDNAFSPTQLYGWRVQLNGAPTMLVGRGYAIRTPLPFGSAPATQAVTFVGVPYNGNLTTPIIVSGATGPSPVGNRLNLIGNPYPSGLSANLFLDANKTIIDGTIYFWTHNTPVSVLTNQYSNNDYANYNLTGGTSTSNAATNLATGGVGNGLAPNGFIAAGQGFFVSGILNSNSTSSVSFTNAMRVTNNTNFYKASSNGTLGTPQPNANSPLLTYEKNRLWLDMYSTDGLFSQLLYGNIEGATNAKDTLYDGLLFGDSSTISIYSLLGNDRLTIKGNGLPFAQTDTNDIGYISKINGNFTIALSNFDGLFDNENIYLEDKLLNVIHDLKASNYNFSTGIGTFNDRFMLRFNNTNLNTEKVETDNRNIYVYKNQNDVTVKSFNSAIESLTIFDLRGRTIYSKDKINANEFTAKDLSVANQVLLVKAKTVDGKVLTQKVIF